MKGESPTKEPQMSLFLNLLYSTVIIGPLAVWAVAALTRKPTLENP
jgi:hypothetical protein